MAGGRPSHPLRDVLPAPRCLRGIQALVLLQLAIL
ncbi:hypothetical protein PoMZ_11319 [Pyricularia oryzae]|uniref:Uncharacterized protein n=1 Tax=Pyricularia oryzae TaxID=318829 RepID=A0A4P7NK39_PYROR|nr:hypothetical protein PoMZ_11319 [Pyricularia oryzae]